MRDGDEARALLYFAYASRRALDGELSVSQKIFHNAKSIADTQALNCENVRQRMNAADVVVDKIVDIIRESGLIDGFDTLVQSLKRAHS